MGRPSKGRSSTFLFFYIYVTTFVSAEEEAMRHRGIDTTVDLLQLFQEHLHCTQRISYSACSPHSNILGMLQPPCRWPQGESRDLYLTRSITQDLYGSIKRDKTLARGFWAGRGGGCTQDRHAIAIGHWPRTPSRLGRSDIMPGFRRAGCVSQG